MQHLDALVERLRKAGRSEVEEIRSELEAACRGPRGSEARSYLESLARGEILEVQWVIEEVVEATAPPRREAPKPAPAPEPPRERGLGARDLQVVYEDPSGLMLHRSRDGKRWFATQVDPRTRQPQTFELQSREIEQLKRQLAGSPYWVLGAQPR